jgi:hypothetical protein
MTSARLVHGTVRQGDTPDWAPLEELVGVELCGQFMWIFDVELADGTRLNAYKHIWTRCYFNLADDGRAFHYAADGRYREVDQYTAIVGVFEDWEGCQPTASEVEALRVALRRARPSLG